MNECYRHLLFFQWKMYPELKETVSHRACMQESWGRMRKTVIGEQQSSVFCCGGQWEEVRVRPEQTRQD